MEGERERRKERQKDEIVVHTTLILKEAAWESFGWRIGVSTPTVLTEISLFVEQVLQAFWSNQSTLEQPPFLVQTLVPLPSRLCVARVGFRWRPSFPHHPTRQVLLGCGRRRSKPTLGHWQTNQSGAQS